MGCRSYLWCVAFLSVCVPGVGKTIRLEQIPHVKQKPDFCGEACVEMWLRALGSSLDQDAVYDHSGLDPKLARGCWTRDLAKSLKNLGFDTGPVWHHVKPAQAREQLNRILAQIKTDLGNGLPTIVCMHYDDQPQTTEHFRLIVGWNEQTQSIIYHEPAESAGRFRTMHVDRFLKLWPLKYKPDQWTVVSVRLEGSKPNPPRSTEAFTSADYCQHIMKLRGKLPSQQFHITIEPPFVVLGDESSDTVQSRATRTVGWAVGRLKSQYFTKDPNEIIDVWLSKDRTSYENNVRRVFGDVPSTPFGYYSPDDHALIMNIATGGGTLVHELVHPFIESNFPSCPAWFNEGLASLYEQSADRGGKIVGLTNWRLAGLQNALKENDVPSFQELCSTSTREFYHQDPGTNYSQARYLCYYLQQKGLLNEYYHAFRTGSPNDPSGYATLQRVLKTNDMQAWQRDWSQFVKGLSFP